MALDFRLRDAAHPRDGRKSLTGTHFRKGPGRARAARRREWTMNATVQVVPSDDGDRAEAHRFLRALAGPMAGDSRFFFQTFDDSPQKRPGLAHVLPGTLAEVWPTLMRYQQQGAGIFVTVNASVGGRKKDDITRIRAVFRDVDTGTAPDLPLEESIRVTTPGGFHSYLLTDAGPEQFGDWDGVMERMVAQYGADPKARDRSRVLRLPGTWHLKDPSAPSKVRIARLSRRAPYTWAEIVEAISPLSPSVPPGRPGVQAATRKSDAELVHQLVTGENYHGACVSLSARYAATGMGISKIVEVLRGLMQSANDGSDRFKARYAEIPRIVASAVAKFAPGSQHKEILVALEAEVVAKHPPVEIVNTVLAAMTAGAALKPAEVEHLLQRLKAVTGIGIRALRDDLRARNEGADGQGTTHADYSMQLLDSLVDASGEHPAVGVEGLIYRLADGNVWQGREAADYEVEVGRRFSGQPNCQRRGDYLGVAAHAYSIAALGHADFFADAPVGLACPDGFVRLLPGGEIESEPLQPRHRQRFVVHASPDSVMCTPLFDQALAQTFQSSTEGVQQEQVAQLQEIVGAAILGLMARHEKVALFYGAGRSGKGTILKIIERLVPPQWRAASSPFRWDQEYYLADLAGKRLNVVGELPEDEAIPAAYFKTVTGRDLLTGRHPSGRPFTFRNEATHIFNANYFPTTRDHSEAFFSRWLIIGFENSRLQLGEGAIDTTLADRIVEQELPGILAWALQGAIRLQARGHFLTTSTHTRLMDQWRRRTDSVMEFLHDTEYCVLGPSGTWKRSALYQGYLIWCKESSRKPLGKGKVFEALESPAAAKLGLRLRRDAALGEVVLGVRDVLQFDPEPEPQG